MKKLPFALTYPIKSDGAVAKAWVITISILRGIHVFGNEYNFGDLLLRVGTVRFPSAVVRVYTIYFLPQFGELIRKGFEVVGYIRLELFVLTERINRLKNAVFCKFSESAPKDG